MLFGINLVLMTAFAVLSTVYLLRRRTRILTAQLDSDAKDLRHAEELERVQAELDAQHDSLQRVGASVLESLEVLTERMVQAA